MAAASRVVHTDWFNLWFSPRRAAIPVYVAGLFPRTLEIGGEIADGMVIPPGVLPEVIRDSVAQVHEGAREAGRDPSAVERWWWPDVNIAPSYREAIEAITMSLATSDNHLSRFSTEGKQVPPKLLPRVRAPGERYINANHVQPGSANARLIEELGLVDYLADRFAVAGTPADRIQKQERAIQPGARRFWMSVHSDDKLRFICDWAERVIPSLR